MKPFAISLSIIAGLLVIGVVFLLIVSGGNLRAVFGAEERTIKTWSAQGPVSSIVINTSDDHVVFRTSGDGSFSVTYYENGHYSFDISQDNGVLRVINKRSWLPSFHWGQDYELTVTMPAQELDQLDVSVSSGAIAFDMGIRVSSLSAHASSGNVTLGGFTVDSMTADVTSGNIAIRDAYAGTAEVRISSGDIFLSSAMIDSLKTSAASGKTRLENCAIRLLDMHSSSGSITSTDLIPGNITADVTSGKVDLELAVTDPKVYKMELSSTSGNISVTGGGYDASTSRSLQLGSGGQLIKIGVTSGNIAVRFK